MSHKKLMTNDDLIELADPLISKELGNLAKSFAGKFGSKVIGEISAAKLVLILGQVGKEIMDDFRAKKMLAFLKALENDTKSAEEFDALDEKDQDYIRGLVVTQLDMQSDERQSEASALLVSAYLHKQIDKMMLAGTLAEIKNTNPLIFYFDDGGVSIDNPWNSKSDLNIKGPLSLPSAFGSIQGRTIKEEEIEAENRFSLSKLGRAFYNYAYVPMSQKYSSNPSKIINA